MTRPEREIEAAAWQYVVHRWHLPMPNVQCLGDLLQNEQRKARDAARDMLAAADAEAWRPIEEAPKDGTLVDLWCVFEGEGRRVTNCYWTLMSDWMGNEFMGWSGLGTNPLGEVTHFRHLPEPPR